MTVLRGGASARATDAPYPPLVRALGPASRRAPDDELAEGPGTATDELVRLLPELARVGSGDGGVAGRLTTVPERRQAAPARGHPRRDRPARRAQPVLLVIEDLHRADAGTRALVTFLARIARSSGWPSSAPTRPTRSGATTRGRSTWRCSTGAATAGPAHARPARPRRAGPAHRGDRGERPSASVLVVVAERSGGRPLVAEELLAARRELPTVSLTSIVRGSGPGADRRPLAGVPAGAAAAGPPDGRCRASGGRRRRAFEVDATSGPPRSSTGPRRGDGVLDADLAAGLDEALEHGFVLEDADGASRCATSSSGGRSRPTCCRRCASATTRPWRAALADQPFMAMHHFGIALDARRGHAAIAAADLAAAVDTPADELAALELAIASQAPRDRRHVARRAAPRPAGAADRRELERARRRGRVRRRPTGPGGRLPRCGDRRRGRPPRPGPARPHLRPARPSSGGSPATPRARSPPGGGPSSSSHDAIPGARGRRRRTRPAAHARGHVLRGRALARDAIRIARACDPPARRWELHATTTLGVSLGWRADPEAAVAMLTEAERMAEALGDLDELFRVYANLTTVLDLAGRHEEAVAVAFEGIDAAAAAGLEAVYGNFLRGNAADSLFLLGRWEEARAMSMTALEWLPAGVNFLNTLVSLATVEIELSAGRGRRRLLGQTLLELEAVRDAQQAVPLHLAAASFALWRGDLADARRAAERGWTLVRETEDWILAARTAATAVEVEAAAAAEATRATRPRGPCRRPRASPRRRQRGRGRSSSAMASLPSLGSRRLADAWLATARAPSAAGRRRDDPATWTAVGDAWTALHIPYETARARWREAEAMLGSGRRARRSGRRADPADGSRRYRTHARGDATPARAARAGRSRRSSPCHPRSRSPHGTGRSAARTGRRHRPRAAWTPR